MNTDKRLSQFSELSRLVIDLFIVFSPNIQPTIHANPNQIIGGSNSFEVHVDIGTVGLGGLDFIAHEELSGISQEIVMTEAWRNVGNVEVFKSSELSWVGVCFCLVPLISPHVVDLVRVSLQKYVAVVHKNSGHMPLDCNLGRR
jgi:hypothetical protein